MDTNFQKIIHHVDTLPTHGELKRRDRDTNSEGLYQLPDGRLLVKVLKEGLLKVRTGTQPAVQLKTKDWTRLKETQRQSILGKLHL